VRSSPTREASSTSRTGRGSSRRATRTDAFNIEFQNSDQFTAQVSSEYERLLRPFTISRGGYDSARFVPVRQCVRSYLLGQQRRASGQFSWQQGSFYDGTLKALGYTGARLSVTTRLSVERTCPSTGWTCVGPVHHRVVPGADRLRLLAAHVRERPGAVQLQRRDGEQQSALPVGSTSRAASCSWSTRTSANPGAERDGAEEPRVRGEGQPSLQVLTPAQMTIGKSLNR